MKSNINGQGEHQTATTNDHLFYRLANFMFNENYCKRRIKSNGIKEGEEDPNLVGLLLCTQKNARQFCRKNIEYREFSSMDDVLEQILYEQKSDGGYVLDGTTLSNKVYFRTDSAIGGKFDIGEQEIDTFLESYLPEDFTFISGKANQEGSGKKAGTKTRTAIAMGLLADKGNSYLIRQTKYDGTNIGKLVSFGEKGVDKEFFLYKTNDAVDSDFYFDSREKVIGVVKDYKSNEKYFIKPKELSQYLENKGELRLYKPEEAFVQGASAAAYIRNPKVDLPKTYLEKLLHASRRIASGTYCQAQRIGHSLSIM
jgi:hypothetical protein